MIKLTELKSFKLAHVTPWFKREWKGILIGAFIKIVIFAAFAAWGITHYIQSKIPAYEIINREVLVCSTFICNEMTTPAIIHVLGYLLFIPLGLFIYHNHIKKGR